MKILVTGFLLMMTLPAVAQPCPVRGEKPMLLVRLYFGLNIGNRPIPAADWEDFLSHTVTPRFPDGLTVIEAKGQWQNARTKAVERENTKLLEIAGPDTAAFRGKIVEISDIYRKRFQQHAIGKVTTRVCGTF
jgi:hypothetical protein